MSSALRDARHFDETSDAYSEAPPAPRTLEETGLSSNSVTDLLLKTLHAQGVRTGQELIEQICLPYSVVDPLLLEMQQRMHLEVQSASGHGRGGYRYALAPAGRDRAREALEQSTYVGPAPLPLARYSEVVRAQSVKDVRVSQSQIDEGLKGLTLPEGVVGALGPAVNSARSLFLYGAPGNGKTAVAERISTMTSGTVWIPQAIDVDGQVVMLFDPVYHDRVDVVEDAPVQLGLLRTHAEHDRRFVQVKRPTVFVGGELTLEQLDLQHDPVTKLYKAPFQLKAAGGVLILDDFGRQRVEPRELLNRWVVPLEKGIDFLTLHTGVKFPVPFDCRLVFATNLDPGDLVEEAFLRRIHYKIRIVDPGPTEYRKIFQDLCAVRGIAFEERAVEEVWNTYYVGHGLKPRACHPRDLLDHMEDFARFRGEAASLDPSLMKPACETYFLLENIDALAEAQGRYKKSGGA